MSFNAADFSIRLGLEGGDATVRELRKVGAGVDALGQQFQDLRSMWMGLASSIGLTMGVRELLQMADSVTILRNRLELATGSATKAAAAFDGIFQAAQSSRTSFTELGATYATVARAGQQLGLSQSKLMTVTQAIGNAMAIGGGSAASMQAALVQLGQGMSSGVLRGEELNSVMEQAPRLAQALADGLGVPIGQLRKLGEQGALTSQLVIEALTKSAPKLAEEVKNATMTFGQALTVLDNSMTVFVGRVDEASGISKLLASALVSVSQALDAIGEVIKANETAFTMLAGTLLAGTAVLGAATAWATLKGVLVLMAPLLAGVAAAMTPVVLTIAAIAAAIGLVVTGINAFRNSEAGLKNRIQFLEGGDSIRGPRGAEREAEIARLRQRLALKSAEGLDVSAEEARLQRSASAYAQQQADLKKLTDIKEKLAGVDKDYVATVQTLAAAVAAGNLPAAEYARLIAQMAAATKEGKAATQASAAALRERQKALADSAALEKRLAEERLKIILDAEAEVDAYEAAQLRTQGAAADAAEAAVKAVQAEFDSYGKLKSQIAQTTLEVLKKKLADEEAGSTAAASIYRQIKAQEELVRILQKGEARDAGEAAAKKLADDWQRTTQDIERSLTDALMRGFEGGRGFVDSFVTSLKSAFKTLVLQPTIRAIMTPVAGSMGSLMGGPAAAGQGGGLGGTGLLGGLGSLSGGFSAGLGAGASALFGEAGFAGAMSASGTALAAGNIAGGLGTAAGALGPYALAAMALYSLYDKFKHRATPHRGSAVRIGAGGAASTLWGDGSQILNNYNAETDAALRGLGGVSVSGLNSLATAFGGLGNFNADARFAADGKDASIGQFVLNRGSRRVGYVGNGADFAKYGSNGEEAFKAFTTDVARATRTAIDGIGLPQWAREQFNALGSAATLEQFSALLDSVVQFQTGLKNMQTAVSQLGGVFGRVAGLGGDALKQLVDLAGGLEQLGQQAQGYVQNYYSRDEIAGLKAREIKDALSAVGITTDITGSDPRAQFRALLDGVDVGSEAGRKQFAALLGVSGAFTDVADYLSETGGTLSGTAAGAPALGALGNLFASGATQQVTATNEVRDAVREVRDAVRTLQPGLGGYRGSAAPAAGWEVTTADDRSNLP